MKLIPATDRYLAKLIFVPLISTLTIAAMLLLLDKMLRLFDFVASEGGPVSIVWRMLANLIPEYMSLGIPIGLMMGILLAFRKLALSSELDIFKAVGQGYGRLLRVPFAFALFFTALNFVNMGFLQPYSQYLYQELDFQLRSGALGASIKVGEFNSIGEQMTMRIDKSENKGKDLSGLFVYAETKNAQSIAATAERGQFMRPNDPDTIVLRLTNGALVHNDPSFIKPRVLSFSNYDVPIPLPKTEAFRNRGGFNREQTLPELYRLGHDQTKTKQIRNEMLSNFHFRLAEVAMMFLLPFLAVALAVPPKRSSSALGVFLSIIMIVAYHKVNEFAESVGRRGEIEPVIALWVPFAVFAAIILRLYYVAAYVPGGQPIGALERIVGKTGKILRKLLPQSRRDRAKLAAEEG